MAISISRAVLKIVQAMKTTPDPASVVAERMWPTLGKQLAPAAIHSLAREALVNRANDLLHHRRHPTDGGFYQQYEVLEQSVSTESVLVRIQYANEAGDQTKPLMEFTVEDCVYQAECHRRIASGYLGVARWMDLAREQLVQHKVALLGKLPLAVKKMLEEKWPQ